jgi:hypothetical protein
MRFRKIISKTFRRSEEGMQAAADVNAVIAANVGRSASRNHVSSRQSTTVVQRGGKTVVSETHSSTDESADEQRRSE